MRAFRWRWLVAALRLGQGRIVLKAEGFPADRLLDRTVRDFAGLALTVGALGRSRKAAGPVAGCSAATRAVAPKPSSIATVSGNIVFMATLLASFCGGLHRLRRAVATLATIDPIVALFDLTRAGLARHVSATRN